MKHHTHAHPILGLMMTALLLSACGAPATGSQTTPIAAQTAVPTISAPTETPSQPTPTFTPQPTLTTKPNPTRTPIPATATPEPLYDTPPAFIFTTKDGEDVQVAASMMALVLPLPGRFVAEVKDGSAIIGIQLGLGRDRTTQIITDTATPPQESSTTDIFMTWGEPSPVFGTAASERGLEIPIFMDAKAAFSDPNYQSEAGWKEGFLAMLKSGRRIFLKGTLKMPIVDPRSKEVLYALEYRFGENASITWDKNLGQLVWHDMTVTQVPVP